MRFVEFDIFLDRSGLGYKDPMLVTEVGITLIRCM